MCLGQFLKLVQMQIATELSPSSACSAQTAQLPRSPVRPTQPKKQAIAQELSNFVNRAQCLISSVPKKQPAKQPKTKTVDIETQCRKPLTQHKKWRPKSPHILHIRRNRQTQPNLLSKPLHYASGVCTIPAQSLYMDSTISLHARTIPHNS